VDFKGISIVLYLAFSPNLEDMVFLIVRVTQSASKELNVVLTIDAIKREKTLAAFGTPAGNSLLAIWRIDLKSYKRLKSMIPVKATEER
jgi:hypothetical protein